VRLKIAALTPRPSASVTMAAAGSVGLDASDRSERVAFMRVLQGVSLRLAFVRDDRSADV
jgi:hypothetical protein